MKKTDWPIRWDLLLRYRLIEIIALWEGRLTTNHICHAFGIGRQQASKDINTYLREVAPGNLAYDRHRKGYVPASDFQPAVTRGEPGEYEELLGRHEALSQTFESLDIGAPDTGVVPVIRRQARPEMVRGLVRAIREGRCVDLQVVSPECPSGWSERFEPHHLVCDRGSWLVRGWSQASDAFCNRLVHRLRGEPRLLARRSQHHSDDDESWHTQARLVIRPARHLSDGAQSVIADDYGMAEGRMVLDVRAALVPWILDQAGLAHSPTLDLELELANTEELTPLLGQEELAGIASAS
nr:WYL domain-containing protein [Tamilnaduibacter salinus]